MPKYFVRLEPNGAVDTEGEELPDQNAVSRLADAIAFDLRASSTSGAYQRLVIVDEQGKVVCERPIVTH